MCFVTDAIITRRKLFSIHQLSLNEAESDGNKFIVEYNTILHDPANSGDIYYSLFDFLKNSELQFDEFRINATESAAIPEIHSLCSRFGFNLIEEKSKAFFTILNDFDSKPENYLASLSKNKREQIRRSIKHYNQYGDMVISCADGKDERIDYFRKLGVLHQQYWKSKGNSGSFANPKWIEFHTRIITNYPDKVQLIRISFGNHVLGYLYNLIDRNIAYSIQSGFNYSDDKNDRPGIISHFVVTNDYIRRNIERYEYLAGEAQYKESLSNDHRSFCWYQIQRKTSYLFIENALISLKRAITKNKE